MGKADMAGEQVICGDVSPSSDVLCIELGSQWLLGEPEFMVDVGSMGLVFVVLVPSAYLVFEFWCTCTLLARSIGWDAMGLQAESDMVRTSLSLCDLYDSGIVFRISGEYIAPHLEGGVVVVMGLWLLVWSMTESVGFVVWMPLYQGMGTTVARTSTRTLVCRFGI